MTRLVLPLVVAGITFLTFLPTLDAGFLDWDDDVNLIDNPRYRGLGWPQLSWMFRTTLLGHYIPLTWMSFGLNYVLGGMSPWGYHLGNVLLHTGNAVLMYFVAQRLLAAAIGPWGSGVALRGGRDDGGVVSLAIGAAFAALVFGVHPLRVESVAWVTERRDVLCGLFYLLAVLAYLRGVQERRAIDRRWWGVSLGAFVLALLSKAAAMPLPAALLILDVYPLRRVRAIAWRQLLLEKVPYLLLAAGAGVLAVMAQSASHAMTGYQQYGIGARIGMTMYSLIFYPWKFLWTADLSPLYELPPTVDPLAWRFLLPGVGLIAVTAVLIMARRRCPGALAAWVYSSLLVLPVSGAVVHAGVQLVGDRYTYLSGMGFAVLAGGGLAWLLTERGRLKATVVQASVLVAAMVILGWAAGAWRQGKVWHDSESLWRRAQEVDPDCVICSINLGAELNGAPSRDPRRAKEAETLFRHAITLRPDRVFAYHGLGVSLALQRRYEEAELAFREYMAREPGSAIGPTDLGLLRLAQGRPGDAIPLLRRAFAIDAHLPDLRANLARALREHGEALRRDGNVAESDALLTEAATLQAPTPGVTKPGGHRSATSTVW